MWRYVINRANQPEDIFETHDIILSLGFIKLDVIHTGWPTLRNGLYGLVTGGREENLEPIRLDDWSTSAL